MNSDPVVVDVRGMFCGEDADGGDGILLQGTVNWWGGQIEYNEHRVGVVT